MSSILVREVNLLWGCFMQANKAMFLTKICAHIIIFQKSINCTILEKTKLQLDHSVLIFIFSQRCRLNDDTGVEYIRPWEIGKTVDGAGGIGEVIVSRDSGFKPGDLIIPNWLWPWKMYFTIQAAEVRKV